MKFLINVVKEVVHPKKKMLYSFTFPHAIPNIYVPLFVLHKWSNFEKCGHSFQCSYKECKLELSNFKKGAKNIIKVGCVTSEII